MKRKIKFRAWDKKTKQFLKPWPNGFAILGETTCFDLIGQQLKESTPKEDTLLRLNDVELSQFTGLLAKNGEVYEGDILASGGDDRARYLIEWNESSASWFPDTLDYTGMSYGTTWKDQIIHDQIIGNIYENPELLTIHHNSLKD